MNAPTKLAAVRSAEKDDSALVEYLDILMTKRKLIAATVGVFLVCGIAYSLLASPVYQASMMVQVDDGGDGGGGGAATGGGSGSNVVSQTSSMFTSKSPTEAEMEILTSRKVTSAAVDELKLYIDASPKRFPVIGKWIARGKSKLSTPGAFGLGGYGWGAEEINVEDFDVPPAFYGQRYIVTALGNDKFSIKGAGIETAEGQVGQALNLTSDEGPLRLVVHSLKGNPGAEYNLTRTSRLASITSVQGQMKVLENSKDSGIIDVTFPSGSAQGASDILTTVGKAYLQQNIDRGTRDAQKSLDFLDQQLPLAQKNLESAEDRYSALRQSHGTIDLSDESRLALQQGVDLQTQLISLQQKRQELALRYAPNHPAIRAIDEQIGTLQGQIGSVDAKVKSMPALEQNVVRLQREVQVNTTLYTDMLVSQQTLQLAKAGQNGSVRIVDYPAVPETPIKPKRLLIIILSIFAGLMVGVALAFMSDVLFSGVSDATELEERTGLPVYATVPDSLTQHSLYHRIVRRQKGNVLLASTSPDDPAIESLRSLRVAMQLAMHDAKTNVLLFTGPAPGVGKSFVTANFASVLASSGKRVLLIDADMRKGYLNHYFGVARENGLSDLLDGKKAFGELVHRDIAPNVDLLTSGLYPQHSSELLSTPHLETLLKSASQAYDYVVLDAPPVLPVADACIIASLVGIVLLVARSGVTRTGEVNESVKRLAAAGGIVAGTVFNGINPTMGRIGYKYGGYRYSAYKYQADGKQ